ncbi:hypothetical protein OG552_28230 [Streptomyces sp. NBC_01476]|uniref:hypothetical protein n=1 Tax=Streptomyces sp. NBC_01476 TaxID=2903881 RepID=UPI002E310259|nr:hypothetical protein [Streptomyces sp. NBC_01476]
MSHMSHTGTSTHSAHAWHGHGRLGTDGQPHHHHARADHGAPSGTLRAGRTLMLAVAVLIVLAAAFIVLLR